ncbi:MAG TPA: hypothetical protein PKK00_08190 [Bacteroidales bacterium]|nr:hypothetical protein [Bacteroidales bacterium]HPS17319.1 hypothetical protein [Bacteroidales bacterium]
MRILIGIDDTDNLESRGTGFRSREMGRLLTENGIAKLIGVTRHQLLFDRRIPYTSHNSSACLEVESEKINDLQKFCADYLLKESADGSDAGLCVAPYDRVSEKILQWGLRAKKEIITQVEARKIASEENIFLEGYTGTKGGIIGSLAAVGLRKGGNDGRFLWIKGMRELIGVFKVSEIKEKTGIHEIKDIENNDLPPDTKVFLADWWRPVLKKNKIVIFAEQSNEADYGWKVVSKEYIKSISN